MHTKATAREVAVTKLLDYLDLAKANDAAFTKLVRSHLSDVVKNRLENGAKQVGALQAERLVRRPLPGVFSKAPTVDHFKLKKGLKDEILSPVNWLTSALSTHPDKGVKALGGFLEGAKILLEKATPIGRAASIGLFIYDNAKDAIEYQGKKHDEKVALEHDVAFYKLYPVFGRCVIALEKEATQCSDSRAYTTHSGVNFWEVDSDFHEALSWVSEECRDDSQKKAVLIAAYRLAQNTLRHRRAIHYINEQLLQVALIRELAKMLASEANSWAADPESIPSGKIPSPPYRYEDRRDWIENRAKILGGYCRRLRALDSPLSKTIDSLRSEMFHVSFFMGLGAQIQQMNLDDAKRGCRIKGSHQ